MQAVLKYADNMMIDYTNPVWFQTTFDTLTGLFDWGGLKTNIYEKQWLCYAIHARQSGYGNINDIPGG